MKKWILLLAGMSLFGHMSEAQKGFDSKRKNASSEAIPTFHFEEVKPAVRTSQASRVTRQSLHSLLKAPKVIRDTDGSVIWLEAGVPKSVRLSNGRVSVEWAALDFLKNTSTTLSLKHADQQFQVTKTETDEHGQMHIRMQQHVSGVPVYGSEIILHSVRDSIRLMNGRYFPDPKVPSLVPGIDKFEAESVALRDVAIQSIVGQPTDVLGKRLCEPSYELVVYHPNDVAGNAHLTWHVTIHPNLIERWEYFVDAQTGAVLNKFNHTCGLDGPVVSRSADLNNVSRTFGSYQIGSAFYMIDTSKPMFNKNATFDPGNPAGSLWTIDAASTSGDDLKVKQVAATNSNSWDKTAVSAHYNAGVAYDYYLNTFKRKSLNGKDGTIISIINISDEEDGKGMDNAFWNGAFMGYGNGRDYFKSLAGGLDVAGHEMTHGVIQNSANLEYQGQSGAINESMADVFGVLIDRDDWTVGEDVVKTSAYPSGALRSMSNPNQNGTGQNGYQPKTMTQYIKTSQDNGGVHINSGIPNYAFYLIASKIGREKSEQIYYRALTQYLTRKSQFLDLRLAIVQSATDFYGAGSAEVTAAQQAFDAVGIVAGAVEGNPEEPDLPVNNGSDGILVMGADNGVLYQTTPDGSKFTERSKQGPDHKPSVTDDGTVAYFVSGDHKIRAITLTGTPREQVVSEETIWDNVAISRDGKKLAALTTDKDNSVYVYSFEKSQWKKFTLYNPTYSDGITTGEVQYADALVWDASGQNLVYDAFNSLTAASGKNHDYWDVGFLRVWNNATNNFGDGNIEKLFSNLDEGENIGNPAFSKNSPNIIAFDYYYEPDESYSLLGVDIAKGNVNVIYENNTLGFPDYSRKDDQMVFNMESGSSENVGVINLAADRISASGTAKALFTDGKWAVWYGQGTRESTQQAQTIQFAQLQDRVIGDAAFDLAATASSGLTVTFSVVSGGVAIQGKRITMTKAGKAIVRAGQPGNDQFKAASNVDRTFCINPTKPQVSGSGKDYTATSTGAAEYIWFSEGKEVYRTKENGVSINQAGVYEVRAVTADGCLSAATQISTNIVTGREALISLNQPYPNPVSTEIILDGNWNGRIPEVSFTDASGRVSPANVTINGTKLVIPATSLRRGLHVLTLKIGQAQQSFKIIKQ